MSNSLFLTPRQFTEAPHLIFENDQFSVTAFTYPSGVRALKLTNSRGYLTVLPYMGLMIWDAVFDGQSLKMKDMFSQPLPGTGIVDTYGCFQFSSGLLANGTPGPEDDYQLHGEFPTSEMTRATIKFTTSSLTLTSEFEYVKGFGHHYLARPAVTLHPNSGLFDIQMTVKNLSHAQDMPLQYMCHMNYAYVDDATLTQNIPDGAFHLRESVPDHVHPTADWLAYNAELLKNQTLISQLSDPNHYDPEIVYCTDDLSTITPEAVFQMHLPTGATFETRFKTADFPIVTRWILHNPDQQVGAFALPGTSRPEGYHAAEQAGTLIFLAPQAEKSFTVTTGITE
ncbi:aldose 1-epimerase family protein [Levilactobacillus bambusae]|uniref:aldose 1-epimerase family protein n=1 Tax=Levilactobacillus bambusae TaxID=2024736 RepID=UPI001CDA9A8F|nr:aldose 1-epimerase family protein [Levilactobacillus bambusae]